MQSSAPTQTWKKKNATGFCQLLSVGGDITILKQVKLEQHEQPKLPITQADRKKEEQKKKSACTKEEPLRSCFLFFFFDRATFTSFLFVFFLLHKNKQQEVI